MGHGFDSNRRRTNCLKNYFLMKDQIAFQNTETSKLLNYISFNTPSFIPQLNTNKQKCDEIFSSQTAYNGMKE